MVAAAVQPVEGGLTRLDDVEPAGEVLALEGPFDQVDVAVVVLDQQDVDVGDQIPSGRSVTVASGP